MTVTEYAAIETTLALSPDRLHSTWNKVIGDPFADGADILTRTERLADVSAGAAGVEGTSGVRAVLDVDHSDHPTALRARVLHEYARPGIRFTATRAGPAADTVTVETPADEQTASWSTMLEPRAAGTPADTAILAADVDSVGATGVAGTSGITAATGDDQSDHPTPFSARTEHEYVVRFSRPSRTCSVPTATVPTTAPPSVHLISYPRIVEPRAGGGSIDTVAAPGATSTDGAAGVAGTSGITADAGDDQSDHPTPFSARTEHAYVFPLSIPLTVRLDPAPDAVRVVDPVDVHRAW